MQFKSKPKFLTDAEKSILLTQQHKALKSAKFWANASIASGVVTALGMPTGVSAAVLMHIDGPTACSGVVVSVLGLFGLVAGDALNTKAIREKDKAGYALGSDSRMTAVWESYQKEVRKNIYENIGRSRAARNARATALSFVPA